MFVLTLDVLHKTDSLTAPEDLVGCLQQPQGTPQALILPEEEVSLH